MTTVSVTINVNGEELRREVAGEAPPPAAPLPPLSLEDDPAAPAGDDEIDEIFDRATASIRTNIGTGFDDEDESAVVVPPMGSSAAPPAGADVLLAVNPTILADYTQRCMSSSPRVKYGLGAKAPFHGARPGIDYQKIDCSGFVREALWLATTPKPKFPDGSVVQHDWIRTRGFKRGTVADGTKNDNDIRIAFLRPQDTSSGIGHVVLIQNGRTFESHGGVGPDVRSWTGSGWQGKCYVYTLSRN